MKLCTFAIALCAVTLCLRAEDKPAAIECTGTVQPDPLVEMTPQVSGTVVRVMTDLGAQAKKGDLLAQLDPTAAQIELEEAMAKLQVAEASLKLHLTELDAVHRERDRTARLVEAKAVSKEEVDAIETKSDTAAAQIEVAKASVQVARAGVEEAKLNLSRTQILCPIDGLVLDVRCTPGQNVVAGGTAGATPLFVVGQMDHVRIAAVVSEKDVVHVRAGQTARFTVAARPGETFEGRVHAVRLAGKKNATSYGVIIDAANAERKLLPYFTANVTIVTGPADQ